MSGVRRLTWYVRHHGRWHLWMGKVSGSLSNRLGAGNVALVCRCVCGCGCNVLSLNFSRRKDRGGSPTLIVRVVNFCRMKK